MKSLPRLPYAACLATLVLSVVLSMTGCNQPPAPKATVESTPEPELKPVGQHELTASPPVTVPDLDRLLGLGFTPDEVVSEIQRRGVLKLPEPSEREHIQRLPRGDRLLDTMEAPRNLLSAAALTGYGRRQAGAPNVEQWRAAQLASAQQAIYRPQAAAGSVQQQAAEYQHRRVMLAGQISLLKKQRRVMQKRGEAAASITIQIERLEREQAALVPPY